MQKVSLSLKNRNVRSLNISKISLKVIWKYNCDQRCWLSQLSVKYLKTYTNLVGNIMLMTSPLNWIEPILSSSKEENLLALLKYQDQFIEYAIFESYLSCGFLIWAQNFSTIQWIVNLPVPIQAMTLEFQGCSHHLNIGKAS